MTEQQDCGPHTSSQAGSTALEQAWERTLVLAWEAFQARTTPVGAVVASPDGSVVAAGRGRRYEQAGPAGELANAHIAHAEINALAQLDVGRHWEDHHLLTSLEPCGMCHGAAVQATVGMLSFAAPDPYGGTAALRWDCPQSQRRILTVNGPLSDSRGAFAALLHLVWLMERGAEHVVAEHSHTLPELTSYALRVHRRLAVAAECGEYSIARRLGDEAPW